MTVYQFPRSMDEDAAAEREWLYQEAAGEELVGQILLLDDGRLGRVDRVVSHPGPGGGVYVEGATVNADGEQDGDCFEVEVAEAVLDPATIRREADRMLALLLGQFLAAVDAPAETIDRFVAKDRFTPDEAAAFASGRGVDALRRAIEEKIAEARS